MKTSIKNLFLLPALIAALGLIPAGRVMAQIFTNLHSFTISDGQLPLSELILAGDTLYGTTRSGPSGDGVVFAVRTNGTGFTVPHILTDVPDGRIPNSGLVLSGNALYGTASGGGSAGQGTIFAVSTNGTGFTNLHNFTTTVNFTNSDGATPQAELILSGNTLYGTASSGGGSGGGTVFAINTDGTGFTNLHSFVGGPSDGLNPDAGLILSGNILYGTTENGGISGRGTVFALNTNGTSFVLLHSFTSPTGPSLTNSDGAVPLAGLRLSGNALFGTTRDGGSAGKGTVFGVNTDGSGFTNLHSFTATVSSTNSDGATPYAGLILSGNTLYGTAQGGGNFGNGTVFALNTNGAGFTTLYHFTGFNDGAFPFGGLILSDNTLYGTAFFGGTAGVGTVFRLSLSSVSAPQLTITPSGTNVILTWADAAGFTLQSAPAITGTFTNIVPAATSPFTNPIVGAQQFFRLRQ